MPESRWFCCPWIMVGCGKPMEPPSGGEENPDEITTTSTMAINCDDDDERVIISCSTLAERIRSAENNEGGDDERRTSNNYFILDCRSANDYENLHIINSIHVTLPTILQKRLIKGTLSTCSVISAKDLREQFSQVYKTALVVLIDDKCHDNVCLNNDNNDKDDVVVRNNNNNNNDGDLPFSYLLFKKLREDGCRAKFFGGIVTRFASEYPDLCETPKSFSSPTDLENSVALSCVDNKTRERPSTLCYLDIKNMKLDDACLPDSPSSSLSSSCATSSSISSSSSGGDSFSPEPSSVVINDALRLEGGGGGTSRYDEGFEPPPPSSYGDYRQFRNNNNGNLPAQIKPFLFLGNSINSSDLDTLEKYNIKYILNVTPNLPNVFEKDDRFHYLKIPIDDHWSQNLFEHFPKAISFIDEARSQRCGVLVHCLAGISRSVTVIVAYLMYTFSMNLEDAYDLVKSHKPNIAPNLNFMGQLLDFQTHLFGGNPPVSSSSVLPFRSDETTEEHFLATPLSAPPNRRALRRPKQTTECC